MRRLTDQDLRSVIGTVSAGYTIQRARIKGGGFSDSDHYGIVLGRNAAGSFVTWQFHLDGENTDFYWGTTQTTRKPPFPITNQERSHNKERVYIAMAARPDGYRYVIIHNQEL